MIQLPNQCYCSELKVYPANWNKPGASLRKTWYIHYRFYDPQHVNSSGKIIPFQRIIKGMNLYKTVSERIGATKLLLDNELSALTEGYNPITKTSLSSITGKSDINPDMPFTDALTKASEKLKLAPITLSDIKSVIKNVENSATELRLKTLSISRIRRKDILQILDHIEENNPKFSSNRFNKYRAYLLMLFKKLMELEAVESNPIKDIAKRKTVRKFRRVLTPEEREKIAIHLKNTNYTFWRFINIFFHSGGRETELMLLQGKHIDIKRQRYIALVQKGREYREVERTIKDVALPLWKELMETCSTEDYIFSVGLKPGTKKIRTDQISRRWNRHIKSKLGIQPDLYSLKHLNTDETAALLSIDDAAAMNSHTTTKITLEYYAIGEKERQHQRLKQVQNSFA